MRALSRVVALCSIVGLLGGCAISRKQRTVATYGAIGVAVIGAGIYVQRALATCPPEPGGSSFDCEQEKDDERNTGGQIAIAGVVLAIVAQLWPVYDEAENEPMVAPRVVEAPPPADPDAGKLRDPAAVQLAENARTFAAAGKCMEAFGSLKALRRIDPGLADQLKAWDPMVSRCRIADGETAVSPTALPVTPPGPPSQTPPTPTPTPTP